MKQTLRSKSAKKSSLHTTPPKASSSLELQTQTIPKGACVIVGVSGGRDSMALLHALMEQRPDLTVIAAHVNHGLRASAKTDQKTVEKTLKKWRIPLHTKMLIPPQKGNLENWGREERLSFWAELAASQNALFVLTAHHQQDDIESMLLHTLRGSGIKGLSGIKIKRPLQKGSPVTLLRPLLFCSRTAIDAYVQTHSIPFCEDPTNANLEFKRNFLRHQVLPQLRSAFPDFESRWQNHKAYWLSVQTHFNTAAETFLAEHLHPELGLNRSAYRELDLPVRLTVLEHWYEQSTGQKIPDAATLTRFDTALLTWPSGKKTDWGSQFLVMEKKRGRLKS